MSLHSESAAIDWEADVTPPKDALVPAQLTTTVPAEVNKLMMGIPTTVTVKGLKLNTSLARDPSVTADRLIVWDWGRFQNPGNRWQVSQPAADS